MKTTNVLGLDCGESESYEVGMLRYYYLCVKNHLESGLSTDKILDRIKMQTEVITEKYEGKN